jgi:hypothetical protein
MDSSLLKVSKDSSKLIFLLFLEPDTSDDDDDVYLEKITTRGVTKFNPTQKCRPAKGISKRVNIPEKDERGDSPLGTTGTGTGTGVGPSSRLRVIYMCILI